jgi:hypothetical protein
MRISFGAFHWAWLHALDWIATSLCLLISCELIVHDLAYSLPSSHIIHFSKLFLLVEPNNCAVNIAGVLNRDAYSAKAICFIRTACLKSVSASDIPCPNTSHMVSSTEFCQCKFDESDIREGLRGDSSQFALY